MSFLTKVFGDPNAKVLKELRERVADVSAFETQMQALDDAELVLKTTSFKERIAQGATLDEILPEAFALVREASRRALGQRHYDVQMMGGLTLHRGHIAEMRTGEGKTLTATAPLYLNALTGKGVHLVTVNDYLAKRDAVWMGQVFHKLGLSVGCIQHEGGYVFDPHYKVEGTDEANGTEGTEVKEISSFKVRMDYLRPVSRKQAYEVDITYGTNNEFGFDYLRDNMAGSLEQKVQRPLHYAIVDEVDSILIDEARTPLIISAPAQESADLYRTFSQLIRELKPDEDYNIDEKMRAAMLTEAGIHKMEQLLKIDNLYVEGGNAYVHHMEQALKAQTLFHRDQEYVVKDGEIIIVDEFTGRMMVGRRYSDGLHQAIEAKEGVEIRKESQTLATITFQNYFRMYEKLAGMTGTAATEAEEFSKIYELEVTQIPPNKENARVDLADRVYKSQMGKFKAVVREVEERHKKGQPVLLGTASIEKNEILGMLLTQAGVPHTILNAKNHEKEGEIIAQAGRPGAVTVATNMAGRGVDIILGGNPPTPEDAQKVRDLGGLCVIGTERHESRRIDHQLRGRAGRQGDPGATQFYVSMEDDLMRIFGSDRVRAIMDRLGIPEDEPIENGIITGSIAQAQTRLEGHNFDTRKHLLEYDDVLNKHRQIMYARRDELLRLAENDDVEALRKKILDLIEAEVEQVVNFHTQEKIGWATMPREGDVNSREIEEVVATIVPLTLEQKGELHNLINPLSRDRMRLAEQREAFILRVMEFALMAYGAFAEQVPEAKERKRIEISTLLRSNDHLWIEHLTVMRDLRTSIGLRGYGQRDPLIEYKREAILHFDRLQDAIQGDVVYNFFKMTAHIAKAKEALAKMPNLLQRAGVTMSGGGIGPGILSPIGSIESKDQGLIAKVGRNDVCPCGSGMKFKRCHGK